MKEKSMNISELIMNAQQLAPQLAATCCIVNGAFLTLEEVGKMVSVKSYAPQ
jgi:hypothetical protein